jgi:alpha-L-rhamnosidase
VQAGTGADEHLVDGALADWAAGDTSTPGLLTGTAGYYVMTEKLAQMAAATGHNEDAERYAALAADIKNAFNSRFFNTTLRTYTNEGNASAEGTQAANALALDAGLVLDGERQHVLDSLVQRIYAYNPFGGGPHISGGMVSLSQIIRALADNGRHDVLWEMLQEKTRPSYGYFFEPTNAHPHGVTTIPEYWDLASSQNHMILLQISEWFSTGLAGIRQAPGSVGYSELVIRPQLVGTEEHPLTHVRGTYRTPHGEVSSEWSTSDSGLRLSVAVPSNTTATVFVPAGAGDTVEARPDGDSTAARPVLVGAQDGYVAYRVGPGSFEFLATP